MNIATKVKKSTNSKLEAKTEIEENRIALMLPIRTVSEANCSESWPVKHKRHSRQKLLVSLALKPLRERVKLPARIVLTRFAPRELDRHDNLPMSFKYIVDAVCSILTRNYIPGRADNDDRILIEYDQVKSQKYGIKIEINFVVG
jgi:hypothetical protein